MNRLRQLAAWSALTAALVQATATEPWVGYPVPVETVYPTCAPPVTINNTQYLTTTIFETVFYTAIVTTTQPTTEIQVQLLTETEIEITPTTETETTPTTQTEIQLVTETATTPTTQSVTLTATEKLELYTSTTRLTSLRICPTRIANPTFTVEVPMPTQWTWGCPPGWVCKPLQENCDFEAGLPDRNFYCAPNECVPAQALPEPLPNWNTNFAGNSTPLTDTSLGVVALPDVFNMNPTDFGLGYEIFIIDQVITITSTYVLPPAATEAAVPAPQNNLPRFRGRQAQTTIPAPCYTWCNNALLEVQSSGKTPRVCQPNSAYLVTLDSCRACIDTHWADDPAVDTFLQVAPQFQQFVDYCAGFLTTTITGSMTATETSGTDTFTTLVPTTSVTAIPTSDISEPALPTIVTTTVTSDFTSTSVSGIAPEPPSTYTGSDVTELTVVLSTEGSTTTLSGSDLMGATLILPARGASQTEVVTSGSSVYTTEVQVSDAASSSLGDQTSALDAPSEPASATSSGPAVETGDSMAGNLEAPKAMVAAAAVLVGLAL